MTGKEYQRKYQATAPGKDKDEAHRLLIGAERVVADKAAPVYSANIGKPGVNLRTTGEFDAFYAAFNADDLDASAVLDAAPPLRMYANA